MKKPPEGGFFVGFVVAYVSQRTDAGLKVA